MDRDSEVVSKSMSDVNNKIIKLWETAKVKEDALKLLDIL